VTASDSFVSTRRALTVFVMVLQIFLGAAVPMQAAADGGNAGLVHACVNRWTMVRIVGPNDACDPGERTMHWALSGPEGPAPQPGPVSCPAGSVNCGAGCVNVMADVRNCGACGRACQQGQACTAGVCQNIGGACPAGTVNCGAGCVNVMADVRNCGACGRACQPGQSCTAGVCR
jgi:stigma-specific protein Stig1